MTGIAQLTTSTIASTLRTYFVLTKPNVWWLLVFTGIGGYFAGSQGSLDPVTLAITALSLTAGCAGAETVSNYIERDIDAIMSRTRRRPIPSGKISPPERALYLGLALTTLGIATSALINLYALIFMVFGVLDYVVVYVMLTKRRTPLNVILGSFAGGAPALIGYTAATGFPDLYGWLLAALIVLWIPSHVWSLAMKYKEDYRRAGVPMLPVVLDERKAIRFIVSTVVLLVAFSLALPPFSHTLGPLYMASIALGGLAAGLAGASQVLGRPPSWTVYATLGNVMNIGYEGLGVALIGRNHPIGIIFAALFYGGLIHGGRFMEFYYGVASEIVRAINGIIIIALAVPELATLLKSVVRRGQSA